jgi:hypothetical protein
MSLDTLLLQKIYDQLVQHPFSAAGSVNAVIQNATFLTDQQLRASAVAVSFTWAGLTDTQLRAAPVPVALRQGVNWADKSGTLTTGGTAQNAAAANAARIGFLLQNPSTTLDLWFSTLATAVQAQPSLKLGPGEAYETPPGLSPTGAISVIGSTTAQPFTCREW